MTIDDFHVLCAIWKQGVGSAVNRLNDVVAMIAEVRSIASSLGRASADRHSPYEEETLRRLCNNM